MASTTVLGRIILQSACLILSSPDIKPQEQQCEPDCRMDVLFMMLKRAAYGIVSIFDRSADKLNWVLIDDRQWYCCSSTGCGTVSSTKPSRQSYLSWFGLCSAFSTTSTWEQCCLLNLHVQHCKPVCFAVIRTIPYLLFTCVQIAWPTEHTTYRFKLSCWVGIGLQSRSTVNIPLQRGWFGGLSCEIQYWRRRNDLVWK